MATVCVSVQLFKVWIDTKIVAFYLFFIIYLFRNLTPFASTRNDL